MKASTLEAFEKFIEAVETLAHAVSSVAGTAAVKTIYDAGKDLKDAIAEEDVD